MWIAVSEGVFGCYRVSIPARSRVALRRGHFVYLHNWRGRLAGSADKGVSLFVSLGIAWTVATSHSSGSNPCHDRY